MYVRTLRRIMNVEGRKRPEEWAGQMVFLHDNALAHLSLAISSALSKAFGA
jgi:hypothetical protein